MMKMMTTWRISLFHMEWWRHRAKGLKTKWFVASLCDYSEKKVQPIAIWMTFPSNAEHSITELPNYG